jgi:autotransporter-associated beta strand protein
MSSDLDRIYGNLATRLAALVLGLLLCATSPTHATDIFVGAGDGIDPYFAVSGNTTGTNGLTIRVGSFLSVSGDNTAVAAEVSALSYNQLWVNNQISLLTAVDGTTTTRTIGTTAGSFASDGITDAIFETTNTAFNNERLWLLVSNASTFTSSTQYALITSTNGQWTLPADVTAANTQFVETADLTSVPFGSNSGTGASDRINLATVPATYLYWDSNNAAGLGGSGTWSTSTSDTEWTTASGGDAADGPYAWGSTSGTDYYAGAGLTAYFGGTAGTVTVSGTVEARNGITVVTDAYTLSTGTINLAGSTASANTINSTTGTTIISSVLTGSNGMTKAGAGTVRLDAASTYTGDTTINAGTLQANAASALGSTTAITVNSGGSLLISATNAVNNSAAITLAGGTVAITGTTTDTVGALTLSASSVIDLSNASGARTLTFADSSAINWAGASLQIWNWNGTNMYGTSYGDGDRQIFFGSSASGLTQAQLDKISFYSGSGTGFIGNAFIRSTGEIAAIPEPEVYATAILLLLGLGINFYRRRQLVASAPALAA